MQRQAELYNKKYIGSGRNIDVGAEGFYFDFFPLLFALVLFDKMQQLVRLRISKKMINLAHPMVINKLEAV